MAETVLLGRRERNRLRTRDALQSAAIELVDEHGFDVVKVGDITESADVSARTFFRYFETKADVLLPDRVERLAQVRGLMDRPDDEALAASLEVLVRGFLASAPVHRHLFEAQVRHGPSSRALSGGIRLRELELCDEVAAFVDRRVADDRGGLVGSAMGAAVMAVIRGAIIGWIEGTRSVETPDADPAVATLRDLASNLS